MKRKLTRLWWVFHGKYLVRRKLSFAGFIHNKFKGKYCWADCVGWAYNPTRMNPFKIESSKGCEEESKTHQTNMCYCGGWNKGVCWDTLPKEERDKQLAEREAERKETPELLPF